MEGLDFPTTAGELSRSLGAKLIGDSSCPVERLSPLDRSSHGDLSYLNSRKLLNLLPKVAGGVVLTREELVPEKSPLTFLVVADPQWEFSKVTAQFRFPISSQNGISDQAVVHPSANLAPDVSVGPFTVIGSGATIAKGTVIGSHVCIGDNVSIGERCEIHPRVQLMAGITLGNRIKVFSGSVLGSDGFGLFGHESSDIPLEMPQVGTVVIEDDVRIGVNCTIARATLGETRIGRGVKIDDQVHIAHNVVIGASSVICAQVGIAGSSRIGEGCVLLGRAGAGDNVTVANGVTLGACTVALSNVTKPGSYFLTPAAPSKQATSMVRYMRRLPEIWQRLLKLEARLERSETTT